MANVDNDYFSDVLDTINKYRDRHGKILSSKKLREAVGRVMNEEVEEMESVPQRYCLLFISEQAI